jgi:hypothetical protein
MPLGLDVKRVKLFDLQRFCRHNRCEIFCMLRTPLSIMENQEK